MNRKWIITLFLLLFLVSLFPEQPAFSQRLDQDPYDDSFLLMLNSKNQMAGTTDANELRQYGDVIQDYYDRIMDNLDNSGADPDGSIKNDLIAERDGKLYDLNSRADTLDDQRQRRRSARGFLRRIARGFSNVLKKGGRAIGWAMDKGMDGIGNGAQYIVDDVAPVVIEEVAKNAGDTLLTGGTVNGKVLRTMARTVFRRHIRQAAKNFVIDKVTDAIGDSSASIGISPKDAISALADQPYDPGAGTSAPDPNGGLTVYQDDPEDKKELDDLLEMGSVADIAPTLPAGSGDSDDQDASSDANQDVEDEPKPVQYRPVNFVNMGTEPVTIMPYTFNPEAGTNATMPGASTVVNPGGNSSAYLDLPLGTYQFCYHWDLGEDVDGDGYTDYKHGFTSSFTLNENHSTNTNNAVQVTFSAPGNAPKAGKCGEKVNNQKPDNSLTPEEKANLGTHSYTFSCSYSDGDSESGSHTMTIGFSASSMTADGYTYNKLSPNVYERRDDPLYTRVSFNGSGFVLDGVFSWESDEGGNVDEISGVCTYTMN